MSDQWHYTHTGATHGPVSGVQLRGRIVTAGIGPDDLIWPAGVAPSPAIRADAALAFPKAVPVRPEDFKPAPPDWLPELAEALVTVPNLTALPPPPPQAWIPDVRRAEEAADPPRQKPGV